MHRLKKKSCIRLSRDCCCTPLPRKPLKLHKKREVASMLWFSCTNILPLEVEHMGSAPGLAQGQGHRRHQRLLRPVLYFASQLGIQRPRPRTRLVLLPTAPLHRPQRPGSSKFWRFSLTKSSQAARVHSSPLIKSRLARVTNCPTVQDAENPPDVKFAMDSLECANAANF